MWVPGWQVERLKALAYEIVAAVRGRTCNLKPVNLRRWLLGRRGDLVWNTLVVITVLIPLARLAIDMPRYFTLRTRLQLAADAAAEAAARSVDIPHFRNTGEVRLAGDAYGKAAAEFAGATGDLAGVKLAGGVELAGPFARAFRRARGGEVVLLFIDEFLRFNTRAQDILVRPLLPTPPSVAQAMGIRTDEFVRLLEAPLWGVEWAPCSPARLALACNPWGSVLDPAVVRRVTPVPVAFAPAVARLFTTPVQNAIEASWKAVQGGQLPLPIEYQALTTAEAPDDRRFLAGYFGRLGAMS